MHDVSVAGIKEESNDLNRKKNNPHTPGIDDASDEPNGCDGETKKTANSEKMSEDNPLGPSLLASDLKSIEDDSNLDCKISMERDSKDDSSSLSKPVDEPDQDDDSLSLKLSSKPNHSDEVD